MPQQLNTDRTVPGSERTSTEPRIKSLLHAVGFLAAAIGLIVYVSEGSLLAVLAGLVGLAVCTGLARPKHKLPHELQELAQPPLQEAPTHKPTEPIRPDLPSPVGSPPGELTAAGTRRPRRVPLKASLVAGLVAAIGAGVVVIPAREGNESSNEPPIAVVDGFYNAAAEGDCEGMIKRLASSWFEDSSRDHKLRICESDHHDWGLPIHLLSMNGEISTIDLVAQDANLAVVDVSGTFANATKETEQVLLVEEHDTWLIDRVVNADQERVPGSLPELTVDRFLTALEGADRSSDCSQLAKLVTAIAVGESDIGERQLNEECDEIGTIDVQSGFSLELKSRRDEAATVTVDPNAETSPTVDIPLINENGTWKIAGLAWLEPQQLSAQALEDCQLTANDLLGLSKDDRSLYLNRCGSPDG